MIVCLLLLIVASVLFVPCLVLLVECLSALGGRPGFSAPKVDDSISIAVLMPAHDEEAVIVSTLKELMPQLRPQDQLIVVADNCTDQTAELARRSGATVLERFDPVRRGKGYALDYGLQSMALMASPPAAVVVIDADCQLRQGTVRQLAAEAIAHHQPVQAVYLIDRSAQPSLTDSISAFAFKVKNLVRPLGLYHLNQPCLLTGTGMAFPWSIITSIDLASSSIVEDMKLGFDLLLAGTPPRLCQDVTIVGQLPPNDDAAQTQRTRWEHGHLQLIARYCPQLIGQAIQQRRLDLFVSALDLVIPPLSLLVMVWGVTSVVMTLVSAITGFWAATFICYGAGLALITAVIAAWRKFGRSDLSLKALLNAPFYILWKLPIYLRFLIAPQVEWVRTHREEQGK